MTQAQDLLYNGPQRGCRLVVLTGGPGAGKTAVLELARRMLSQHIAFVPEAAGILFGGGFWRRSSVVGRQAAQRAIYHVQNEQERLLREEAEFAFALCDRGTLDGLAYWPGEENSYFAEVGTCRSHELSRYHAIIHLHTPDASHGYNHQNPLRQENAAEALDIDERIGRAWDGHPRRIFIESSPDFMDKAMRAIAAIQTELFTESQTQPAEPLLLSERTLG